MVDVTGVTSECFTACGSLLWGLDLGSDGRICPHLLKVNWVNSIYYILVFPLLSSGCLSGNDCMGVYYIILFIYLNLESVWVCLYITHPHRNLVRDFCSICTPLSYDEHTDPHCQWEDETVRERIGHPPSYAVTKKMKSMTLHTHGCPKA